MLIIMIPGANQLLVLETGMTIGHKAAFLNFLGITSSMFIHGLFSGLGISLLIMHSPMLHSGIKVIGAGYIIYLGASSLLGAYRLHSMQGAEEQVESGDKSAVVESPKKSFAKGFTTNVLNIQTSFVFLSIFPQFMNQEQSLWVQSLFLTFVFVLLLIMWYSLLILVISRARLYLLKPEVQKWVKSATGSLLVASGIKMVLRN